MPFADLTTDLVSAAGGRYRCIVADPPWRMTTGPGFVGRRGNNRLAYQSMSLRDIMAMPVAEVADDDAHLYLWTTNSLVRAAYDVAEAWGFRPGTLLTWCKRPMGSGLGDAYGITTEFVLTARRGRLKPLRREPSTWWLHPRGRHSAKPEAFQDMIETVTPGPYLELFARRERPGWKCLGNELEAS